MYYELRYREIKPSGDRSSLRKLMFHSNRTVDGDLFLSVHQYLSAQFNCQVEVISFKAIHLGVVELD